MTDLGMKRKLDWGSPTSSKIPTAKSDVNKGKPTGNRMKALEDDDKASIESVKKANAKLEAEKRADVEDLKEQVMDRMTKYAQMKTIHLGLMEVKKACKTEGKPFLTATVRETKVAVALAQIEESLARLDTSLGDYIEMLPTETGTET